jgi:hypothetical protein
VNRIATTGVRGMAKTEADGQATAMDYSNITTK